MNKKALIAVIALIVVALIVGGIYFMFGMPQTSAGEKAITVNVFMLDESSQEFKYTTSAEFLGEVLQTEGLVEGEMGDYGLYVTAVNGVEVDDSKQQWWMLTKGGESVNTGFDTTPIADGDIFEITLVEGY